MSKENLVDCQFFLNEFIKKYNKTKTNIFSIKNFNNYTIINFFIFLTLILYFIFENYIIFFLIVIMILFFLLKTINNAKFNKILKYLIFMFFLICSNYFIIKLDFIIHVEKLFIIFLIFYLFKSAINSYINCNEKIFIEIIKQIFNENNICINSKNIKILLNNEKEIIEESIFSCIYYAPKIFKNILIFFAGIFYSFFNSYLQDIFSKISKNNFEDAMHNITNFILSELYIIFTILLILILLHMFLNINKIIYIKVLKKLHLSLYLKE